MRLRSCRRSRSCRLKSCFILCLLACQACTADAQISGPSLPTLRIGEASHPGPLCHVGTSNPGWDQRQGNDLWTTPLRVWGIAETHLAQPGLRSTRSAFQRTSREYHRHLAVLPGAMVPLRSRSATTGTWAGVMTIGT